MSWWFVVSKAGYLLLVMFLVYSLSWKDTMPYFKLVEGGDHVDTSPTGEVGGTKGRVFKRGDIFESTSELDKKFNSYGSIKFERVEDINQVPSTNRLSKNGSQLHTSNPATPSISSTTHSTSPQEDKTVNDTLESMSLEELKKFAESEEIDIRAAKNNRDQIIRILKNVK